MNQQFITHSPAETEAVAKTFAQTLHGGEVLAFRGGMGVGKTAFVRGLAEGLGVRGEVSSPTFALVHEYRGAIPFYHFDMYRITDWDDLYSTGFFDYLDLPNAILAIEWSEQIQDALPEQTIVITMEHLGEDARKITIGRDEH